MPSRRGRRASHPDQAVEEPPGHGEPNPGHGEGRYGLDGEPDGQIRRSPHDVHGPQGHGDEEDPGLF